MTARLLVEPQAEAELEEAADGCGESVPGLGFEFIAEMRQRTRDVLDAPRRFPPFGGVAGVGQVPTGSPRAFLQLMCSCGPDQRPP